MNNNKLTEPTNGALTNRMDIGTNNFDEFQAILLNKSNEQTIEQKLKIELLALKKLNKTKRKKYQNYTLNDLDTKNEREPDLLF